MEVWTKKEGEVNGEREKRKEKDQHSREQWSRSIEDGTTHPRWRGGVPRDVAPLQTGGVAQPHACWHVMEPITSTPNFCVDACMVPPGSHIWTHWSILSCKGM